MIGLPFMVSHPITSALGLGYPKALSMTQSSRLRAIPCQQNTSFTDCVQGLICKAIENHCHQTSKALDAHLDVQIQNACCQGLTILMASCLVCLLNLQGYYLSSALKGYEGLPQGEAMQINLEAMASIESNQSLSFTRLRLITLRLQPQIFKGFNGFRAFIGFLYRFVKRFRPQYLWL